MQSVRESEESSFRLFLFWLTILMLPRPFGCAAFLERALYLSRIINRSLFRAHGCHAGIDKGLPSQSKGCCRRQLSKQVRFAGALVFGFLGSHLWLLSGSYRFASPPLYVHLPPHHPLLPLITTPSVPRLRQLPIFGAGIPTRREGVCCASSCQSSRFQI